MNVTHRLGGEAAAGELLVSVDTLKQADFEPEASGEGWEARELSVKGRDRAVEAWSLRIAPASERDAAA